MIAAKRFASFVLALLPHVSLAAAVSLPSRTAAAFETKELAAKARPSVVLLTIHDRGDRPVARGTGFFVSKDGRVVTNQHVIDHASKVVATLADGRDVVAKGILAEDSVQDIAIILFPGDDYVPLALGESHDVSPGDEIVVLGSPNGLSASLSLGIVSAIREKGVSSFGGAADTAAIGSSWAIQITAQISAGSSGSPVMTRDGQVIAVAVGMMATGQNLNFAVPAEVPKKMLEALGDKPAVKPFAQSDLVKNLVISAGILGAFGLAFFLVTYFASRKPKVKSRPVIH
ncbi:S1C family serine protease [Pendulispora albinea]|uniref:S1C family serine protease n=1 Tax=Pendulispora albinea TaxID=2741071 RepID=A0ABZ2LYZ7_9BACT